MIRRIVSAAAAAAMLVTLSGCGDEQAPGSGASTEQKIEVLSAADFGRSMATAQTDASSAHLTGTVNNACQTLAMTGDVAIGRSLDSMQMRMTMNAGPGKSVTVLMVDGAFYLKASDGAITKNPAKPWVEIDLDDPTNPFGAMFDQMMSNFDPDKVEKLYSAITRLNGLGIDDVKGVPARHYTVTVDSKKMIEVSGLDEVAGVTEEQLLEALPEEITSQFWLDARNRPVKTSSKVADTTTEMYFSEWGKKVVITPPPADQVLPFSKVSR
jgi:hypothetical protein